MKKIILMMSAVTALAGCSKMEQITDGQIPENDGSGVPVQLHGVISADATRGEGVITGTPALSFDVFRADMVSEGKYTTTYAKKVGGTMTATTGTITLNPKQYYSPNAALKTKFIGVYPAGGAENLTTRTVTYTNAMLDGSTDIMASGLVEGYKGIVTNPSLTFNHLLTKVVVLVKAGSSDPGEIANIAAMWGDITKIALKDKNIGAVVTLPDPTTGGAATIAASGTPADLALAKKSTNNTAVSNITLTGTAQEFGYAMFLPVTTAEKLTLLVNTSAAYSTTPLPLPITTAQTFEAGKSYTITLSFTVEGTTSANASVEISGGSAAGWSDGSPINEDVE
jgi:hypothetical protein